jgi:hypothetical protein
VEAKRTGNFDLFDQAGSLHLVDDLNRTAINEDILARSRRCTDLLLRLRLLHEVGISTSARDKSGEQIISTLLRAPVVCSLFNVSNLLLLLIIRFHLISFVFRFGPNVGSIVAVIVEELAYGQLKNGCKDPASNLLSSWE